VVAERRFFDSYRERETAAGVLESSFGLESSLRGPEVRVSTDGVAVRAYLDSETYHRHQRLRLTVELEIEPDLHVYGQPIPTGYLPLSLEVAPHDVLEVGPLELPPPRPFCLAGLDEQLFVYEGRVTLARPLTFLDRADDLTIAATLRYQVCSDTDCFPPGSLELRLPLRVENHVESNR
jgi:DsbC/DsbD-like thiol-disulfide interchange protein